MIDIIGKRRYGYILSATLMVIGLVFILATLIPNGNVGLQFSIAYTGGTVWEVHFEDGTPEPNDVRAVLEEVGLDRRGRDHRGQRPGVRAHPHRGALAAGAGAGGRLRRRARRRRPPPHPKPPRLLRSSRPQPARLLPSPTSSQRRASPPSPQRRTATTSPVASPGADVAIVPARGWRGRWHQRSRTDGGQVRRAGRCAAGRVRSHRRGSPGELRRPHRQPGADLPDLPAGAHRRRRDHGLGGLPLP